MNSVNMQIPLAFLYTNSEKSEKLTIPVTVVSKRIKYLGIDQRPVL